MQAVEIITKEAEEGSIKAMFELANCYYQGTNGAPMHYAKAMNWFEKVAENGSDKELAAKACHNLMNYYLKSEIEKAEKWARRECEYGSQEGMIAYATYLCEADEFCESPNMRAKGIQLLKELLPEQEQEKQHNNDKVGKYKKKFLKENFVEILVCRAFIVSTIVLCVFSLPYYLFSLYTIHFHDILYDYFGIATIATFLVPPVLWLLITTIYNSIMHKVNAHNRFLLKGYTILSVFIVLVVGSFYFNPFSLERISGVMYKDMSSSYYEHWVLDENGEKTDHIYREIFYDNGDSYKGTFKYCHPENSKYKQWCKDGKGIQYKAKDPLYNRKGGASQTEIWEEGKLVWQDHWGVLDTPK